MQKKFITGMDLMKRWKIESYELMELVQNGLRPYHAACRLPYFVLSEEEYHSMGNQPHFILDFAEIYPYLNNCLFLGADVEAHDRDRSIKKKPSGVKRLSEIHKDKVREIASRQWKQDPGKTIQDVIDSDEVNQAISPTTYNERTLRNWIKDLASNNKPGRRPTKK